MGVLRYIFNILLWKSKALLGDDGGSPFIWPYFLGGGGGIGEVPLDFHDYELAMRIPFLTKQYL